MATDLNKLTPEEEARLDLQVTMECVDAMIRQLQNFNEQLLSDEAPYLPIMLEPALKMIGRHSWESLKKRIDEYYGV